MGSLFCPLGITGSVIVSLLVLTPLPASATIVFDDHFDGDSGGMPAGWHLLFGDPGWVAEAGTTVTLCRDVAILSDAYVDPSQGTVVTTAGITGTDSEYGVVFGLGEPVSWSYFMCGLSPSDGQLKMIARDLDGGEQHYIVGYLNGYSGGPLQLTLVMGPTTFSISTDLPPFSSGPILYTAVFPTFTREDLGSAVNVAMGNDVTEGGTRCSSIDRIAVDVESPTPVERSTVGRIKAIFRR